MKIVHLSTYDTGGATTAAQRINRALQKNGVYSTHLVGLKNNASSAVTKFVQPDPVGLVKLKQKGIRIANELKITKNTNTQTLSSSGKVEMGEITEKYFKEILKINDNNHCIDCGNFF